jgi:hypothetical protein
VRSWIERKRLLAIPKSEITMLIASRVSSHSRSGSCPPIATGSVMFSSAVSTGSRF